MEDITVDALTNLKNKVIKDFEALLCKLNKGYTDVDYCNILQMISFIQLASNFDKVGLIYENLMTR